MPFFKTTRQREEEARNPPPLRDALDEAGANRVADRFMQLLDGICFGDMLPFIQSIAHHHGHYEAALRAWARGDAAEAIRDASHAFESTMKALLDRLGHPAPSATASQLINALADKANLLPAQYKDSWEGFVKVLKGVVTPRNKEAGVGHGSAPNAPPPNPETAEYAINLAGSSIVFLIRLWQSRTATSAAGGFRGAVGRLLARAGA